MANLTPKLLYIGADTAANVVTVSSNTGSYSIIKNMNLCNFTASAATCNVHLLVSGVSAAANNNAILKSFTVAPNETVSLASFVSSYESLTIEGVYTHFAVADDLSHPANAAQLSAFNTVLKDLSSRGINPPLIHAANSAAALANESSRFTMVRLGIAVYGLRPGAGVADLCAGLIPAMSLKARVSAVRWVEAGEAVSYGLVRQLEKGSLIATVPIGYADGVPRALGRTNIQVLLNGVPRTIAGTITMDQLMIDCESDSSVMVGDEVVLIGKQGDHSVTADDWAEGLGTIGYEIVCGISPRIFRRYS